MKYKKQIVNKIILEKYENEISNQLKRYIQNSVYWKSYNKFLNSIFTNIRFLNTKIKKEYFYYTKKIIKSDKSKITDYIKVKKNNFIKELKWNWWILNNRLINLLNHFPEQQKVEIAKTVAKNNWTIISLSI